VVDTGAHRDRITGGIGAPPDREEHAGRTTIYMRAAATCRLISTMPSAWAGRPWCRRLHCRETADQITIIADPDGQLVGLWA
jgi:hypothetical protein